MSKSPKYPVAAVDERAPEERRHINSEPPWDLYLVPSFKFRHEVRPREGTAQEAYYRAYPQFAPRHVPARRARRQAIRNGSW
jgi:hypothetical protein